MILSGGGIGLYACDIAGALGASDRLYVDRDPQRRALAEHYGARTDERIDRIQRGFDNRRRGDRPRGEARARVLLARPRGRVRERRYHFKPGELPLFQMCLNSVKVRSARDSVRANIPPVLRLAQRGRVDPIKVVADGLDWETLPEALPELHTKPVFVREPVRRRVLRCARRA